MSVYERLERWFHRTKLGFVVWRTTMRYGTDSISVRSGMLAYFLFLSLFPLLLLLISLAGFLIPPDEAVDAVAVLMADFPPAMRDLVLQNVLGAYAVRGTVTLIGLLVLAYSASRIYFALSYALNAIWEVAEDRSWYRLYVQAFGVVGIALVLVAGIVALDAISQTFGQVLAPWLPDRFLQDALSFVAFVLSMLGSFALFFAIYRWVPRRRVGWRYLWPGAVVATLLWKGSKIVFAWYLSTLSSNEAVYGSIGVIITLMLWLYFSATILLVGAEVNRSLADWQARLVSAQEASAADRSEPEAS